MPKKKVVKEEKKVCKINKYFVEDQKPHVSKFDLKQYEADLEKENLKKANFNQVDDDEPNRSSDDEFDGKLLF